MQSCKLIVVGLQVTKYKQLTHIVFYLQTVLSKWYWRCDQHSETGCKARIITQGAELSRVGAHLHCHAPDAAQISISTQMGVLKEQAATGRATSIITNTVIAMVPKEFHAHLPKENSIKRKVQVCAYK